MTPTPEERAAAIVGPLSRASWPVDDGWPDVDRAIADAVRDAEAAALARAVALVEGRAAEHRRAAGLAEDDEELMEILTHAAACEDIAALLRGGAADGEGVANG